MREAWCKMTCTLTYTASSALFSITSVGTRTFAICLVTRESDTQHQIRFPPLSGEMKYSRIPQKNRDPI